MSAELECPRELDECANRIRAIGKRAVADIVEIGRLLTEANSGFRAASRHKRYALNDPGDLAYDSLANTCMTPFRLTKTNDKLLLGNSLIDCLIGANRIIQRHTFDGWRREHTRVEAREQSF
jgi:hypothetical protein